MQSIPLLTLYIGSPANRGHLDEADRMTILHKVSQASDSFTMQDAVGYHGGRRENTLIVRIASENVTAVVEAAAATRIALGLEDVGIECGSCYYRAAAEVDARELAATIQAQFDHKA